MKKKTLIISLTGLIFLSGLFLSFTYLNSARKSGTETAASKPSQIKEDKKEHSCCSGEESDEFSEESIYQLESKWTNQDGEKLSLGELKGKPVIMSMFFASCTYACPIIVNDMKKIESSFSEKDLKNYTFVLVSIDPQRDTPEALKKFAEQKNLDLKRWTLLTGSPDNIMELAALLGFKYKKEPDGQYSHSNMIIVLNREGEIEHQHLGLNRDLTAAEAIIKNL